MPEPRITATGDNAGVRPYGRPANGRYASFDPDNIPSFADQIGRGLSYVGGGMYDTARSAVGGGLGGLDDFFSGNSPEQVWQRERAMEEAAYNEARRGILRDTPYSRQARIKSAARTIENAPYMANERASAAEREAALTDMRIEERQAQDMQATEARANEIAAEKLAQSNQLVAAQNESIRLMQEQQALQTGMPVGPTVPFGKKPLVSTPSGAAVAPAAKTMLGRDQEYIQARVDGLIGDYSGRTPTYTAPTSNKFDIGTIDLTNNALELPETATSAESLSAADQLEARGAGRTAMQYRAKAAAQMEMEQRQAEMTQMFLEAGKTEAEIKKINAEIEKMADGKLADNASIATMDADGLRKHTEAYRRKEEREVNATFEVISPSLAAAMTKFMGDPEAASQFIIEFRNGLRENIANTDPEAKRGYEMAMQRLNGMMQDSGSTPSTVTGSNPEDRWKAK